MSSKNQKKICSLKAMKHALLLLSFWDLYVFKKYVRKNISRFNSNTHAPIAYQLQIGTLTPECNILLAHLHEE